MNFLKNLFSKKSDKITSYQDFWAWFENNKQIFFNVVKQQTDIETVFFNKLSAKLLDIRPGFFFLTGMADENTAELVITADGDIKNIVFVEELVNAAPQIAGWKFTALKPAIDIENLGIVMGDIRFTSDNIFFYSNDDPNYPDEIDLTVMHEDLNEENESIITNGVFIFLDNYLGEFEFATKIDNMSIVPKSNALKELVPINKLKDFLNWREKEFLEKYEGIRRDTENDSYGSLSAELENGNKSIAIVNRDILNWDSKASHPWMLIIKIKYQNGINGMPDDETYRILNDIEDDIMLELKDIDGYINIGRETANDLREIYFACKDFRKPSKTITHIQKEYADTDITYDIYKDKYWRSFDRFNGN